MHQSGELHHTTNKIFMKALGIWPREKSRLALLQRVLITMLTVPHICMQLAVFITTQYSMTLFIRVMSLTSPFLLIVATYYSFLFVSQAIINLDILIQEDWKIIRDKIESDVIQCSIRDNQFYFYLMFSYVVIGFSGVAFLQLLPVILDVVLPLDEPRPRSLLLTMVYFVSQNQYFYISVAHEFVFFLVLAILFYGVTGQTLVFVLHSCDMFRLAKWVIHRSKLHQRSQIKRHRVQYSIENSVLHAPNSIKEHVIRKKIMHAAIAHRRAQEFSNGIASSFNVPLSIVGVLKILSLSINLYGIVEAAVSKNMENMILCGVPVIGLLFFLFMAMYFGQKISDCNTEVFNVLCGTSWYLMPVSSQKLLLFLIQNTTSEYYLKVGFIFQGKIENFAMLVNASLSYVTVMYNCANQ